LTCSLKHFWKIEQGQASVPFPGIHHTQQVLARRVAAQRRWDDVGQRNHTQTDDGVCEEGCFDALTDSNEQTGTWRQLRFALTHEPEQIKDRKDLTPMTRHPQNEGRSAGEWSEPAGADHFPHVLRGDTELDVAERKAEKLLLRPRLPVRGTLWSFLQGTMQWKIGQVDEYFNRKTGYDPEL